MTLRAGPRRRRGFSLIELLVTLAILGVLAGGALSLGELVRQRAQEQELRTGLRQIRDALDAHKRLADAGRIAKAADESGYPRTLSALVDGVPEAGSATGSSTGISTGSSAAPRIYLLRRLPRDPLAAPELPAVDTWGLRSYASEADNPRPGRDVFDVYSRAEGMGLNGRAYREW